MNNPKVSIIVPIYMTEKWLNRCVDSILSQSYAEIEVILVDDGSHDKCGIICDKYIQKDKRIKVIHKANSGVSSARNAGLSIATGEFIVFIDSDDRIEYNMIEILVQYQKSYSAECVICGLTQDNGYVWQPNNQYFYSSKNKFKNDLPQWIDSELLASPVNKLFCKKLIRKPFCEGMNFGEDLVFSLDYLDNCKNILFITEAPYLHNNLNENSIVHNFNPNRIEDIETFETRILEFYGNRKNNNINSKYVRDIVNHVFDLISQSDISLSKKIVSINIWYEKSKLKRIKSLPFIRVHWKKKLLVYSLRYKLIIPYMLLVILKQKFR